MKNLYYLFFIIFFISGNVYSQKQKLSALPKPSQSETVDTRIDNMGYWTKMAEKGLVPVAPVVPIPEAVYTGSMITAKTVLGGKDDSPDVALSDATNITESENSAFIDPDDNMYILNSNNSTNTNFPFPTLYGSNHFVSEDAGLTWGGSVQGAGGSNSGDPTTAINQAGRQFVGYITGSGGMGLSYSDNGTTWTPVTVYSLGNQDKNHMWIDNCPTSPYEGNLYNAWTDFGGSNINNIVFKASSNDGVTWGSLINLSSAVNAGNHNQGVNLQTGPNGEVYAIWAVYDSWGPSNVQYREKAVGFTSSFNGGTSFSSAIRIINNIQGIRNDPNNWNTNATGKNMRVNSFPSMAVDISGGSYSGNIYVVWANVGVPGVNSGSSVDVYLIKSSDLGVTWSAPIKINQDAAGMGKKHFFPWITCDPETGILSAIFYDDRNTTSTQCEVWCANSMDGGETWEDFKVSDVAFTPSPISGLANGYMGDYLSITARGGQVYPIWTDTRDQKFMTYTSPYTTNNLPKPTNLTLQLDENTGNVFMGWLFDGKSFLYFNVYRDGVLLGTTTEQTYLDTLSDYGVYQYSVTAMHDEGESVSAKASIQWGNPHIAVTPDEINANLVIGTSTSKSIKVKNVGELELEYNVNPLINNKKSGKDYCDATSTTCDEYISNVTFGDINNSSACDNYHDYTNLSTVVNPGQSYPISVTNGNLNYPTDQCGIWVDWNQDQDFDDPGETITVSGTPGIGPYTADIIPPAGAIPGQTRLRVRITYTGTVSPCGTATYGEVEDYSVFVLGWLLVDNYGGTITPGDSAMINVDLDASNLESGIYTADINIGSNDPDMGMVTVPVTLGVGESIPSLDAYASPALICEGDTTQLQVDIIGGSGTYTYNWTSIPAGFVSTEPDPQVNPVDTTLYIVEVFDGIFTVTDTAKVEVAALPGIAAVPSGETTFCIDPPNTIFTTEGAEFALSYTWNIDPETAGTIEGGGQNGIVDWDPAFTGDVFISVKAVNDCGEGILSDALTVTINPLPDVNLSLPADTVCVAAPAFELNLGTPAGGVYSGSGITENGGIFSFDPAIAGTGDQTITYTYSDENGCENYAEAVINVSECLGINEVVNGIHIELFPNPSHGKFTIKLVSGNSGCFDLRILNNMGTEVFSEHGIQVNGSLEKDIDLSSLAEGLYFIYMNSNKTNYIRKIIISK